MEPETSAEETLEEDVRLNESFYIIRPHSDSELAQCHGFNLKKDFESLMEWKFWLTGVISTVLIIFGFVGNACAMYILRKPKMRSAFNQLLIILCIIDSMFLLSNIPTTVMALGLRIFVPVNSYFTVASHISLCASVLMIVALSHERYFAICSPHIYRIHMRSVSRWKHLAKYIVPVVLVSIICNIPMLINIIDREILKNPIYVKVNLYLRGVHPLSTTGLLPILYLIFANIRISQGIKKLRKPRVATAIVSMSGSNFIELNCNIIGANNFQRNCSKNKRHSKEIRTTYMAISIITSFAVLNFPRFIATIIEVVNTNLIIKCVENEVRYLPTISFYRLDYFARMLMVLNSAINFLIYCAVSTPFKEQFLEHICPCIKWLTWLRKSSGQNQTNSAENRQNFRQTNVDDDDCDEDDENTVNHESNGIELESQLRNPQQNVIIDNNFTSSSDTLLANESSQGPPKMAKEQESLETTCSIDIDSTSAQTTDSRGEHSV